MPKIVDRDAYREELLRQCFDLFAEHGYASITMRKIAKELGVSTGTLYHYFPSKESIFEQLMEYLCAYDTSDVGLLGQLPDPSPPTLTGKIEVILDFCAQQEDYIRKEYFILVDYLQQQENPERSYPLFRRITQRYETAFIQYMGLEQVVDRALPAFLMAWFDGLILRRLLTGDSVSLAAQGKFVGELLETYLRSHSDESS
ncbi:MAG: TetR/AcrR family transcriptional regulator [Cyanobacteriota bacterium]|nr:TetR/AcrR family transcriptional regulator [Cyanobacteriota bacterium]